MDNVASSVFPAVMYGGAGVNIEFPIRLTTPVRFGWKSLKMSDRDAIDGGEVGAAPRDRLEDKFGRFFRNSANMISMLS